MTSPLLPRQTRRLPNTQGLASPRLGHRSPSPPRSSPRQPGRGAEQGEALGGSGGGPQRSPPCQCCRLKDGAPSSIPCLGLGACPGLPVPTHRRRGVLGNGRGSVPNATACRGCRGWGQLVPRVAVLKGALQLLAQPQAESWPEPPPGSYNNKPRSGKHLSPGPERQGPSYPKHLREGAWEAEGEWGGPGGAGQGLSSPQCPRMVTAERGNARSALPEGSIQPERVKAAPSWQPLLRFPGWELLGVAHEAGVSESCGVRAACGGLWGMAAVLVASPG